MNTVKEIYEKLIRSKRPIDFFGNVASLDELIKIYQSCAKMVHLDIAKLEDRYIVNQAFNSLMVL